MRPDLGHMIKQYKEPALYNANGNVKERWFVYFSFVNPQTGKYERIKVYQDLNKFKTKGERNKYAAIMIARLTEALENGYNPFVKKSEQEYGGVNTLADAVREYLKTKEVLRDKTQTGYKSILGLFLKWAEKQKLANTELKRITRQDVKDYLKHALTVRNLAATSHNTELTAIRGLFTFWHNEGLIIKNPAHGIKRLKEDATLHQAYSDKQIEKITTYLKQKDTPRAKQLLFYIRFLYYTCVRPKELRNLKIGHIRLSTDTVLVPSDQSKNGRLEPVDITPGLAEVIKEMELEHLPEDWYVFGNQAKGVTGDYSDPRPGPKPVGVNYFSEYYREILKELGFGDEFTLYGWKHTRNVHLWVQDKDLLRLMRHNRHTDPKVTMRYLRSLGLLVDTRIVDERRI